MQIESMDPRRRFPRQTSAAVARRNVGLAFVALALFAVGCGGPGRGLSHDPTELPAPGERVDAKQLERAVAALTAKAAEQPDQPYWETQLGAWYARAGLSALAAEHLQRALALDPDSAPALSLLSKLDYEAGCHAEAIARLEAVRDRHGSLSDALLTGLALHYEAVGRTDESEAIFAGLQDSDAARSVLAYRVLRSDHYLQASPLARQAVEEQPESAANHNNYGIALLYEGRPQQARDEFVKALELDPDLAGAMYNLAIVEKVYFYDEEASRQWFARYRTRSPQGEDPDGLEQLLAGSGATDPLALQGK
jgi:Tfp pilus assembly protein PilF